MINKFDFRKKKISYSWNWIDNDTFVFQFVDGEFKDLESDYFIHFEYHKADNEWVISVWWEDDNEVIGFDGSDEYITKQEIEEVKEFAKQFIV